MDEIGQEVFKRQTGSAPTFRSIDGVGPKTAEKVKGTIAEGDADSVYQQFIGELEERRDRNQEREPSDGSGIQSRANERLNAAQNLFGGDR
jgi:hypothetical protein